jgi:hypothetical protein
MKKAKSVPAEYIPAKPSLLGFRGVRINLDEPPYHVLFCDKESGTIKLIYFPPKEAETIAKHRKMGRDLDDRMKVRRAKSNKVRADRLGARNRKLLAEANAYRKRNASRDCSNRQIARYLNKNLKKIFDGTPGWDEFKDLSVESIRRIIRQR